MRVEKGLFTAAEQGTPGLLDNLAPHGRGEGEPRKSDHPPKESGGCQRPNGLRSRSSKRKSGAPPTS